LRKAANVHTFNARRQGKLKLPIAASKHRSIHSEANCLAPLRYGALHHGSRERTVALDVKLKPDGLLRAAGNLINGCSCKRADDKRRTCGTGSSRGGKLAFRMKDALVSDGGEQNGRLQLSAEQRNARIDL